MFQLPPLFLTQFFSIVTTVTAIWLSIVAWRQRPAPGAVTLTLLMATIAVWASALAVAYNNLLSPELRQFAAQYGYFGVAPAPVLAFLFVLIYTGFGRRNGRTSLGRRWLLLWIIPILTLCLAIGYPWTRLLWASYAPAPGGMIVIKYGPWIAVSAAYSWSLMVAAALVMSLYAFSVNPVYRRTALMVAVAMLVPLVPSVIYVFRLVPGLFYDFTSVGMLLGAVLLLIAVQRGRLLVMRPMPSSVLLEQLADAILVLNADLQVVDCNRAALDDLGLAAMPRSRPLPELLEDRLDADTPADSVERWSLAQLLQTLRQPGGGDGYMTVIQPRLRHFQWRVSPLGDTGAMPSAGWMLVWRDVTQERLKLAMLYEQERALRLVAERQQQGNQQAQHTESRLEDISGLGQRALKSLEHGDVAAAATALVHLSALAGQAQLEDTNSPQANAAVTSTPTFLAAVAGFLRDYQQVAGCSIDFVYTEPQISDLLSSWFLVQLVRIMQETLEAIREHVAADSLQVALNADAEWVILSVLFTCAACREGDQRADTPASAKARLDEWLPAGSVQQRLAAAHGLFITEAQERTGRVTIRLPRADTERELRRQRVLLGTVTPARAKDLGALLQAHGMEVAGASSDAEELVTLATAVKPHLILADWSLINLPPASTIRQLRSCAASAKLVAILASVDEEAAAGSAVRDGIDGYLLGTLEPTRFVTALAELLAGHPPLAPELAGDLLIPVPAAGKQRIFLTDRQSEIMALIVRGYTYREIAMQLYLGERTVRYETQDIRKRMQVATRSEMVDYAIQHHLID